MAKDSLSSSACPFYRVVAPLMRLLHEAISKDGWAPARLLIASFNQYDMIEVSI